MSNTTKIQVAVLCNLSNSDIRARLPLKMGFGEKLLRKIHGRNISPFVPDIAVWNTNLIEEIRAYPEKIEMHIIAPYYHLANKEYEYEDRGVFFKLLKGEESSLFHLLIQKLPFIKFDPSFKRNRIIIKKMIDSIRPDIMHIIGAENPQYSIAGLDCPKNVPLMVQLQTLMIDPVFKNNYPLSERKYCFMANVERQLLEKADYICTPVQRFVDIIKKDLCCHADFFNTVLPLAEPIHIDSNINKEFDFVYFSANISKAADLAIAGFILASKQIPGITLDVIGDYSIDFKKKLELQLEENGIKDKVTFEGRLLTHEDVLVQIRKSRYALLPLKVDMVSGTIRESMANGLPVVTTITHGTPILNKDKRTVLLSPIGDHHALADNMVKLYNDQQLAESMIRNGVDYMMNNYSNTTFVKKWVDVYDVVFQKKTESAE